LLYTWSGPELYRFDVIAGRGERLKSFAPLRLLPNGPSVNQAGDRILVATSDRTFPSFRLPALGDERSFQPGVPEGCWASWDKPRYTGFGNTIDVAYAAPRLAPQGILVYEDDGRLVHRFEGIGGGGITRSRARGGSRIS